VKKKRSRKNQAALKKNNPVKRKKKKSTPCVSVEKTKGEGSPKFPRGDRRGNGVGKQIEREVPEKISWIVPEAKSAKSSTACAKCGKGGRKEWRKGHRPVKKRRSQRVSFS